jgi:hypothetical protein
MNNRKQYLSQAIGALQAAIQLPETQNDEDRTYQAVIGVLNQMVAEYGDDPVQAPAPAPAPAPQMTPAQAFKVSGGF